MNIFYDTEFLENGKTIDLISIGMVADTGREYYAVNSDIDANDSRLHQRISEHSWLMDNVVPYLPLTRDAPRRFEGKWLWSLDRSSILVKPHWVIANEVRNFLQSFDNVKLWADYGAYDHVVLCQLFGRMIQLPDSIPMWTHDLRMLMESKGMTNDDIPPFLNGTEHNALDDARELRWRHDHVLTVL